jgi:hypothetical protein
MRTLVALAAVSTLLAGCAQATSSTGGAVAPGPQLVTQTIVGADGGSVGMNMVNEATAVGTAVDGTPEQVWSALEQVYVSLEIPLSFRDTKRRTLGNTAFRTRRRVGPVPMYRALNCGGESGMPNAETYDVTMDIASSVTAEPGGKARLSTLLQASARRPSGGSGDVRCSSQGALEERIATMVKGIIAGK